MPRLKGHGTHKKLSEKIIGAASKHMVIKVRQPPVIAQFKRKAISQTKVALVTTSGIVLKAEEGFDTKNGDTSFRIIPKDTIYSDIKISHDHYDKSEALKDLNVIFPLTILKDFENEGIIKQVAPRHFGLMGYIPQVTKLRKETAPAIANILVEDEVDIVLLSPGWYICHQSVGLIQREIESRGIRTASISHLPDVSAKLRPPRFMDTPYPLGRSFGLANQIDVQREMVLKMLNLAAFGGDEERLTYTSNSSIS